MARFTSRVVLAAMVAALALGPGAWADDTELFVKGTVPPNVLVILDTSQSMTWYDQYGNTVGDGFDGAGVRSGSRVWTAKSVLSNVVSQFADKINFGLASYNQGDVSTNVAVKTAANGAPMSWYYSESSAKWPFDGSFPLAGGYYINPDYFDLRVPQTGLAGDPDPADATGYNPDTFKPNSPSFTLTWAKRAAADVPVASNPLREFKAGQASIAPVTVDVPKCEYQSQRSADNATWSLYGSPWYAVPSGCPAAGTTSTNTYTPAVTITDTCAFLKRLTGDTPKPYQHSCQRYNNGSATGNPWTAY